MDEQQAREIEIINEKGQELVQRYMEMENNSLLALIKACRGEATVRRALGKARVEIEELKERLA